MNPSNHQHKHAVALLLRQFALRQIDLALDYVTNPAYDTDIAIHEMRRCLKRLRALLRLAQEVVGETIYDRDNRYLRRLGQRLAALRDVSAMQQTLLTLQKNAAATLTDKTWKRIKQELQGRQQAQREKKALTIVATKLSLARSRIANWPLELADNTTLQKAMRKSYRRGRRAMKEALAQPQAENLHEWRKQVNHLRHQVQILQTLKIVVLKKTLKASRALAQTLGLHHDLAVLSQRLSQFKTAGRETELNKLVQLVQAEQASAQTKAAKLGHQLYRTSSKAFLQALPL